MARKKNKEKEESIQTEELKNGVELEDSSNIEIDVESGLRIEIEKLESEISQSSDKFLRLLAEFENYKRRTAKEKLELVKTASRKVILEMIPVLDDFERGMESMGDAEDIKAVKEGVDLIYIKMRSTLKSNGLEPMETKGEEFDTDLHEAISQIPAANKKSKNKIIAEVEKGYKLNETVIRFSKVVVGI